MAKKNKQRWREEKSAVNNNKTIKQKKRVISSPPPGLSVAQKRTRGQTELRPWKTTRFMKSIFYFRTKRIFFNLKPSNSKSCRHVGPSRMPTTQGPYCISCDVIKGLYAVLARDPFLGSSYLTSMLPQFHLRKYWNISFQLHLFSDGWIIITFIILYV